MAMTIRKRLRHGWTRVARSVKRRRAATKAVRFMREQHRRGTIRCPHGYAWHGHCAHSVACAYGRFASGWDAYQGYRLTPPKHRRDGSKRYDIPRGAFGFFKVPSDPGAYGHVVIGNGRGGKCWGVDRPINGRIGMDTVRGIEAAWGMTYVGWVWPDQAHGW